MLPAVRRSCNTSSTRSEVCGALAGLLTQSGHLVVPRNPRDVQQIHLNGVKFDTQQLIGEGWKSARIIQFILGDEPLLVADAGQDPEGELDNHVVDPPEDAVGTTEGGSPSALSAIPEEADSDFSGHIQQAMPAAWQEVEGSEDLTEEDEELETDDSQQSGAQESRPRVRLICERDLQQCRICR